MTEVGGRFTIKVTNTDLYEIVEAGRTYGPYRNSERDGHRRKPFWVWSAAEEDAFDVLQQLAPWLSPRRISRAYELSGISRFP